MNSAAPQQRVVPRVPRNDRLPPLTAFGVTLLLTLLAWTGIYELIELVRWVMR